MLNKIIIFDFDGTIADTGDATIKVYNQIAKENNLRIITKDDLRKLKNMGALEALKYFNIPLYKLPFIVRKVRVAFKDEILHLKLFDGIKESITKLKLKGYKLYILSTNSKENIQDFLKQNNIQDFEDVFAVSNMFGKHIKIKSLLKNNNWRASDVMYVGDEVRDILAARKAEVVPISVAWGYNSADVLLKNTPVKILHTPIELGLL